MAYFHNGFCLRDDFLCFVLFLPVGLLAHEELAMRRFVDDIPFPDCKHIKPLKIGQREYWPCAKLRDDDYVRNAPCVLDKQAAAFIDAKLCENYEKGDCK